ncbi:MAG: hypothetical protein NT046_00300 [Arenimonas sp.]|nr:hypothetical protein [Arenimonas sp.]
MRRLLPLLLLIASPNVHAACEEVLFTPALAGIETIPTCPLGSEDCLYSGEAVFRYAEAIPDDPAAMGITAQGSPWRLYGPDNRILTLDFLAKAVRGAQSEGEKKVVLVTSWSGVAPSAGVSSLADQLSKALDGFPVEGQDGFLWISPEGRTRTTQQAYSVREGAGSYGVPSDKEVFVPLAAGWAAQVVATADAPLEPELVLAAGVGWDAFSLCPTRALEMFERAGHLGLAIGAYNAAQMLLARGREGDREAALQWLRKAAAAGDQPAAEQLASLTTPKESS